MKPLVPYLRKSSKEDPVLSRDRQSRAIAAWSERSGVPLADEEWEPHVSGGKNWRERSPLGEAIAAVERGEASGIIVEEQSRLSRENGKRTAEVWDELQRVNARLVCVADGLDTATGDQEFSFTMRAAMSREQWKQYARRMEHVKASRIALGIAIAGTVPVGYVRPAKGAPYDLDPDRWEHVRDAFELRASGAGYGEVARFLDGRLPGGPSGDGAWNRNTVTRLLANRTYLGEARQGKYVKAGAHDPIVSQQTFDAVQALAGRAERPKAKTGTQSLLAGIVCCAACGYALDRNTVGNGYLTYRCRRSGICPAPTSAMMDALDALVTDAVLDRLAGCAIAGAAVEVDASEIHTRLAAARAKRDAWADPDVQERVGNEAWGRGLAKVDAEIAGIEGELADAITSSSASALPAAATGDVAEIWPTLSTDERREVISSMVEGVTVSRGVRGDLAGRVSIFWRGDVLPISRPSRGRRKRSEVEATMAAA